MKKETAKSIHKHRELTRALYEKCRTGKGKDIPKLHNEFLKSYNEMERLVSEEEKTNNQRRINS